jgi:tetratricopeptide (TPR) repeat protein
MRVQAGVLQPDTQRQLNALLQAGGEANDLAIAFASGYLARQDLEQAGKLLAALDANGKRAGDADYYWSIAARIKGDLNESKAHLESVLKRSPNHELAHEALGEMLLEARRPNDALNHYLIVLRDAPTADSARIGAARCFRQMGKWKAAGDLLKPVLESGNPAVIAEIGQINLERGDYQAAIADFDQVAAVIEKDHEGRMAAATAKALTGNHGQANELLDQDARLESLQKQLRELQIRVRLYPEDSEASRQLKAVKEQVLREPS